jgi:magnesium transporter
MNVKIAKPDQPRISSINRGDVTWTDITSPTQNEIDYLAQKYNFHHLALEDSLSRTRLTKIDDYETYLFLVFHFPVIPDGKLIIKSTWLSVFIGRNYLITLHDSAFAVLTGLFQECQAKEETQQAFFSGGPGYLLYRILDRLVEHCFPILDKVLTLIDDMEDSVFDESIDDTKAISTLRRDIIILRRIIWPSRAVMLDLKGRIKPFAVKDLTIYFDNLLDHVNKIWDNLEESKEVVEVYKDSDFVLVTSRINRIVQALTVISSILLPFLIVSSIYGMNINLPGGLERGSLLIFGILLGIMLCISGGMLYFMHRRRWI